MFREHWVVRLCWLEFICGVDGKMKIGQM
jgi:hypothetical protein